MADNGSIQLEGLDEVLKALGAKRGEINRAASGELRAAGMGIIADSQVNLRKNTSWVTGMLGQSGRVIDNKDEGMDVGFFDKNNNSQGYALYVEYGRKAGRMPPPSAIAEWVYKKLRVRDRKAAGAIGWAMSKIIARRGTRPHPFFNPACEKWKNRIAKTIADAVRQVIK